MGPRVFWPGPTVARHLGQNKYRKYETRSSSIAERERDPETLRETEQSREISRPIGLYRERKRQRERVTERERE